MGSATPCAKLGVGDKTFVVELLGRWWANTDTAFPFNLSNARAKDMNFLKRELRVEQYINMPILVGRNVLLEPWDPASGLAAPVGHRLLFRKTNVIE